MSAGEYFHCFTESIAACRRAAGPLTAFTSVMIPFASTCAVTTTVPCVPACLATEGYVGCIEEINFGSRMVLADGPDGLSEGGGAG